MTKTSKIALSMLTAGAVALANVPGAQAAQITGSITFTGGVQTDNNSDVGSSTKVTGWTGINGVGLPTVLSDSGSFTSVAPGSTVTFVNPWTYNSGSVA